MIWPKLLSVYISLYRLMQYYFNIDIMNTKASKNTVRKTSQQVPVQINFNYFATSMKLNLSLPVSTAYCCSHRLVSVPTAIAHLAYPCNHWPVSERLPWPTNHHIDLDYIVDFIMNWLFGQIINTFCSLWLWPDIQSHIKRRKHYKVLYIGFREDNRTKPQTATYIEIPEIH